MFSLFVFVLCFTIVECLNNIMCISVLLECLYQISHEMPLAMLENQSIVVELIEYLLQVSEPVANQLFDAILPLTKISASVRDHLILMLRKALYLR